MKVKDNKKVFSKRRSFKKEWALIILCLVAVVALYLADSNWKDNAKEFIPQNTPPSTEAKEDKEEVTEALPEVALPEEEEIAAEETVPAYVVIDGREVEVVDGPPMHGEHEGVFTYTVKDGDTLWDIAEQVYGDAAMWTLIWDANADLLTHLDPANADQPGHWIHTGTDIVIPDLH